MPTIDEMLQALDRGEPIEVYDGEGNRQLKIEALVMEVLSMAREPGYFEEPAAEVTLTENSATLTFSNGNSIACYGDTDDSSLLGRGTECLCDTQKAPNAIVDYRIMVSPAFMGFFARLRRLFGGR